MKDLQDCTTGVFSAKFNNRHRHVDAMIPNGGTTVEVIPLSATTKEYIRPFVVEDTKLTRLLEVIHECLASPGFVPDDHFEVFGKDRVDEASTLDEVFKTANSRENPVHRLVVTCPAAPASENHGNQIRVDFDGEAFKGGPASPPPPAQRITVRITSDAHGWANRTLSAVEEQVDRTRFDDVGHRRTLAAIVLLLMILIVSLFVSSLSFQPEQKMWLSRSDIHQLAKSLEANKTLTDEQVREIVTMQLRNVVRDFGEPTSDQIPSTPPTKRKNALGALLLFAPLVVAFALAVYLLVFFYPTALFLWGDAMGRYEHLKYTRNILWSAVVGITFLFPLTFALRAGLLSYLAQH
jgi:hypothetical protein